MSTTSMAGLANDPLLGGSMIGAGSTPLFGNRSVAGNIGGATTGSNVGVSAGKVVGTIGAKTTPTTGAAPCPVNCREENTPVTYYISTTPSPGSTPVRGQQKRVICDTPPQGTPQIPCEELNTALQNMGRSTDPTRRIVDSAGNPVLQTSPDQNQYAFSLNDNLSGAFYPEFL